ncbi:hypothetical protein R9C00_04730 [Flammeovirgaceae bacterium SG7u.111]|nr:hypothetical protein [Flammeovirgaceae bacterium SG7u.132]WPO36748.1 hypothetical protein R9C00_04730 [Flammeovirgaceae bacterium SG7u.111]
MRRLPILFYLLLTLLFDVRGQGELQDVVPPTPNAASILRYIETPVGHFTGVPNIQIPIYTVQSKTLTLPISLSYHAGGNKVGDIASWVGLGWSLSPQPSITRVMRGLPDEGGYGYFNDPGLEALLEDPDETDLLDFQKKVYEGQADGDPDIFMYSLPDGKSGEFFYDQTEEEFYTNPHENIIITFDDTNQGKFKIVSDDGTTYIFDQVESSSWTGSGIATTWYASKIVNASKTDQIEFTYASENQTNRDKGVFNEVYHLIHSNCDGVKPSEIDELRGLSNPLWPIATKQALRLEEIIFSNGKVKFNVDDDTQREDLIGGYALESIEVLDNDGEVIKKISFEKKYVTSSSCPTTAFPAETKRMLLEKIHDGESISQWVTHSFEYNETIPIPCRLSFAEDYWGYYNGKDYNQKSIPNLTFIIDGKPFRAANGANRNVDPSKSQFAILKKINYPTGGFTEFEYENHRTNDENTFLAYDNESVYLANEIPPSMWDEEENGPYPRVYETSFTINNPSDPYLNANNPNGGGMPLSLWQILAMVAPW